MEEEKKTTLTVEEVATLAIGIFADTCKEIAEKNWCKSQIEMLDTLFEAVRMGCEYRCVKCTYFGRPADSPETVEKECLWSMCKEGEGDIPPCEEK